MDIIKKIIMKLVSKYQAFKAIYRVAKLSDESLYRIEEVDTTTNKIIIHSRTRTIIKTTMQEAVVETMIVDGLSSIQACWLGYYFAKSVSLSGRRKNKKAHNVHYELRFNKGRFKIVSYDTRMALLNYLDTELNIVYKEPVVKVAQDEWLISNIDPSQACYIGMLVGYEVIRRGINVFTEQLPRPVLKIVK